MDTLRTPTKGCKHKKKNNKNSNNNKNIKVVYISNPMKVKTSASEFRALVQELTGQDAELPPDPSKFKDSGSDDGGGGDGGEGENHQVDSNNCVVKVGHDEDEHHHTLVVPPPVDPKSNYNCEGQLASGGGGGGGGGASSIESFEPFDEVFTPQMIENISSLLPSSMFYESPQVDQVVMQCNYVHQ